MHQYADMWTSIDLPARTSYALQTLSDMQPRPGRPLHSCKPVGPDSVADDAECLAFPGLLAPYLTALQS